MLTIVQVRFMMKMKLNSHNRSDMVWSMMKTRKDNDMINHIGAVYAKSEMEFQIGCGLS